VAQRATPADGRQEVLAAFSRALGRESHILRGRAAILWQQTYNRLQWEEEPVQRVLEPAFRERTRPGSGLWFHEKTPLRESGGLVATLAGHESRIQSCAFSPDGAFVVSIDWGLLDCTLNVWNARNGELVRTEHDVRQGGICAFSPDGRFYAATAMGDGRINLWDTATGTPQLTLQCPGYVTGFLISPDGRQVLVASGLFYLWNAATGEQLASFECPDRITSVDFAWSPDQRFLMFPVSGARGAAVQIWDLKRARAVRTVEAHSWPVAFGPDGTQAVTMATFPPATLERRDYLRSPDKYSRAGGDDYCLKLWELKTGKDIRSFVAENPEWPGIIAVSPDGRLVVSVQGNALRVWDAGTGLQIALLTGHTAPVNCFAFSGDGRHIVSGSDDRTLKIWDVELAIAASEQLRGTELDAEPEGNVARRHSSETRISSPDGQRHVGQSDGADPVRTLYQGAESATVIARFRRQGGGGAVACNFSPDGSFYVGSGGHGTVVVEGELPTQLTTDGEAVIWDLDHQASPLKLAGAQLAPSAFVFSPDGRFVLAAFNDRQSEPDYGTLRLYDFGTGAEVQIFAGHKGGVTDFAFSPDGRAVVSAGADQTLRFWDRETGENLATLPILSELAEFELDPGNPGLVYFENRSQPDGSGRGAYLVGSRHDVVIAGLEYGPLVVTATEGEDRLTVRCPRCGGEFPVKLRQLGQEGQCPEAGCGARLRLNPFTMLRA